MLLVLVMLPFVHRGSENWFSQAWRRIKKWYLIIEWNYFVPETWAFRLVHIRIETKGIRTYIILSVEFNALFSIRSLGEKSLFPNAEDRLWYQLVFICSLVSMFWFGRQHREPWMHADIILQKCNTFVSVELMRNSQDQKLSRTEKSLHVHVLGIGWLAVFLWVLGHHSNNAGLEWGPVTCHSTWVLHYLVSIAAWTSAWRVGYILPKIVSRFLLPGNRHVDEAGR